MFTLKMLRGTRSALRGTERRFPGRDDEPGQQLEDGITGVPGELFLFVPLVKAPPL